MGKINVLSFAVANLIAAGEVVDRPSSVIKELMENAIDSGADRVIVEIQNGGTTLMRVTDNGCGIEKDDLQIAVRRHATSKIRNEDDLNKILTLGFRGEALAAIAAVSDLRIISHVRGTPMGAEISVSGGNIIGVTDRGSADGTTVVVENLFANVPARRKFLKKDVTETAAVHSVVEKVAMSHPEISFSFMADGITRLQTSGNANLHNTIYSIYGRDFSNGMIPISYELEGVKVSGFTGRSDNVKANRNWQTFYINNRVVKSKTIAAAVEQAYCSYLPQEKFPVCVVFLTIPPQTVDVNVHPSKLEVKFSNEKIIFESVYYAIKTALENNTTHPDITPERLSSITTGNAVVAESRNTSEILKSDPENIEKAPISVIQKVSENNQIQQIKDTDTIKKAYDGKYTIENYSKLFVNNTAVMESIVQIDEEEKARFAAEEALSKERITTVRRPEITQETLDDNINTPSYRICGEIFKTYIIIEQNDKILLVDKHAAHERIIFEKLKKNLSVAEKNSQTMAVPIDVTLTSAEIAVIKEYRNELEETGFNTETLQYSVKVYSIPDGININDVGDIMMVIADQLINSTGNAMLTRDIIFEKALYQASCKAAIKAGIQYADEHINWLIEQLMAIPDITFCPHGRPVAIEMKKSTLDHQFKRT